MLSGKASGSWSKFIADVVGEEADDDDGDDDRQRERAPGQRAARAQQRDVDHERTSGTTPSATASRKMSSRPRSMHADAARAQAAQLGGQRVGVAARVDAQDRAGGLEPAHARVPGQAVGRGRAALEDRLDDLLVALERVDVAGSAPACRGAGSRPGRRRARPGPPGARRAARLAPLAAASISRSSTTRWKIGSRPVAGSSSTRIEGRIASASVSASAVCWPFERRFAFLRGSRSNTRSRSRARASS